MTGELPNAGEATAHIAIGAAPTDDDIRRHDFKNQLGIILGFSEILRTAAAAGDPRRGDLEEIHRAASAALDLLEHLYPARADTPR